MKFLIVKTSSLGDIIHAFPALQYLREKFPESTIDWVVEAPFANLVESHPDVSSVIPIHTRSWKRSLSSRRTWKEIFAWRRRIRNSEYDVVFDLQGNCKSALVLSVVKARKKVGFGRKSVAEWPNLFSTSQHFNPPSGKNIRDDYLFLVKSHFEDDRPFEEKEVTLKLNDHELATLPTLISHPHPYQVLVCPGAAWRNKQLSLETLKQVLKTIEKKHPTYFLFAWGSTEEQGLCSTLCREIKQGHVLDKCSLPLLQNLMRRVNLVIAMDSLPLHLCGTTSTASLSFFGPSSSAKYRPKGTQHRSIEGTCPYGMVFEKRCPRLRTCATGCCIKKISSEIET